MKLETLEDLLEINTDALKSPEKGRLLTKVKQLIKASSKKENNADELAKDFPYEGVSIVGNKFVQLSFDLESKQARVMHVAVDARDSKGRNHMAVYNAVDTVERYGKKQKEIVNE